MTILDKTDFPRKLTSVGCCPPFFEMKIMNEQRQEVPVGQVGEIVGRGPILMPDYYKRPDLTEKAIIDGWLYTGDLGFVDEDGYLTLVDRKKDMIISGGINVYPKDIEEIIVQHPAVREAAVFGMPHEKWGETPVAAVILRQPGLASAEDLKTMDQRPGGGQVPAGGPGHPHGRLSPQHRRQDPEAGDAGGAAEGCLAEKQQKRILKDEVFFRRIFGSFAGAPYPARLLNGPVAPFPGSKAGWINPPAV